MLHVLRSVRAQDCARIILVHAHARFPWSEKAGVFSSVCIYTQLLLMIHCACRIVCSCSRSGASRSCSRQNGLSRHTGLLGSRSHREAGGCCLAIWPSPRRNQSYPQHIIHSQPWGLQWRQRSTQASPRHLFGQPDAIWEDSAPQLKYGCQCKHP